MSHDVKCHELAEVFLQDSPDLNNAHNVNDLAETIQDTIEDWISRALEAFEKKSR